MKIKLHVIALTFSFFLLQNVQAEDLETVIYDNIHSGFFSCTPDTFDDKYKRNMNCTTNNEQYLYLSGWERISSENPPTEINPATTYSKRGFEITYGKLESGIINGVEECNRSINLVKAFPEKWDLKIVSTPSSNFLVICEAINQHTMAQYIYERSEL